MIVKSGFFSSFSGDKPYSADDFNTLFGDIITPGIMPQKDDTTPFATEVQEVSVNDSIVQVTVGPGRAFVEDIWVNYDGVSDPFYIPETDVPNGQLATYVVSLSIDRENRWTNMGLNKIASQEFSSPTGLDIPALTNSALSSLNSSYFPLSLVFVGLYADSVLYFEVVNLAGTEHSPYARCNLEAKTNVSLDDIMEFLPSADKPLAKSAGGTGYSLPDSKHVETSFIHFPLNAKNPNTVPLVSYTVTLAKGYPVDNTSPMYDLTADDLANLVFPSDKATVWNVFTIVYSGDSDTYTPTIRHSHVLQFWWGKTDTKIYVRSMSDVVTSSSPLWSDFAVAFDRAPASTASTVTPGFKKIFTSSFSVTSRIETDDGLEDKTFNLGTLNVYNNEAEKYLWFDFDATNCFIPWSVHNVGGHAQSTINLSSDEAKMELINLLSPYLYTDDNHTRVYALGTVFSYKGGPCGSNTDWDFVVKVQLSFRENPDNNLTGFYISGRTSSTASGDDLPNFRTVFTPIFYETEVE